MTPAKTNKKINIKNLSEKDEENEYGSKMLYRNTQVKKYKNIDKYVVKIEYDEDFVGPIPLPESNIFKQSKNQLLQDINENYLYNVDLSIPKETIKYIRFRNNSYIFVKTISDGKVTKSFNLSN